MDQRGAQKIYRALNFDRTYRGGTSPRADELKDGDDVSKIEIHSTASFDIVMRQLGRAGLLFDSDAPQILPLKKPQLSMLGTGTTDRGWTVINLEDVAAHTPLQQI